MDIDKLLPLVEKSIEGDKKAYSDLCEAIIRDVLYVCIKITGDVQHGEDAAQEALVRLSSSITRLRNPHAFPLWLNRHLVGSCRDYLRKEKRHNGHDMDGLFEEIMEENIEFLPEQWAEKEDTRQMVLSALHELPAKQQHILLLYYFQNMSTKEIARINKITESTVRSKLQYARTNLKRRVEKAAGTQLTSMPAMAAVPTITLILRQDAARLVTEESTKRVLVALGSVLASGATAITGVQTATLVAGFAPVVAGLVVVAAVTFGSSPSPSNSPTNEIGITPQYSDSVFVQDEGEGDLYIEAPSSQAPARADSRSVSQPLPPDPPTGAVPYTATGQVVMVDGQGNALEHRDLSLRGICVQAYYGDTLAAQGRTNSAGSYTLALPDDSLTYTLRVAGNALPEIGNQRGSVVLRPGMTEVPDIVVADNAPPRCVFLLYDDEGQPRATVNPATIELAVRDATPCEVRWEIAPLGEVAAAHAGSGTQITVAGLGLAPGQYTLSVTVTDLGGNQTFVDKQFTIR